MKGLKGRLSLTAAQSPLIAPSQSARCSFFSFFFLSFFFGRYVRRGIIYTTQCRRPSSCQCARHLCGLSSLMNRAWGGGGGGLPGCSQTDADWWAPGCKLPADKRVTSTQKKKKKKRKNGVWKPLFGDAPQSTSLTFDPPPPSVSVYICECE